MAFVSVPIPSAPAHGVQLQIPVTFMPSWKRCSTASQPRRKTKPTTLGTRINMGILDSIKGALNNKSPSQKQQQTSQQDKSSKTNPFLNVKTLTESENTKWLQSAQLKVDKINSLEDSMEKLSNGELRNKADEFRKWIQEGRKTEDEILVEAFALVREMAFRTIGLRHFDVQLVGGMALHEGRIAEMATGEGKTLVSTLPVFLNALRGDKTVLVVTVNDYLAKRDASIMGQVHKALGLTVGLVQSSSTPEERRAAYDCDVTYVTNSELGFDYLRDNLALSQKEIVLTHRKLGFCIVDEADSILIDEARTPLIISGKVAAASAKYTIAAQLAEQLLPNKHYVVDEKEQNVVLTEDGSVISEKALKVKTLFDTANPWAPFIANALKAKEIFKKDINYVIKDKQVMIVDEFTGRVLDGRRWGNGLHQAVEAKEKVDLSDETQTIASISFQSFFKLFTKLSGMTGTAATDAGEFLKVYDLDTVQIPTVLPVARKDYPDVVFKSQEGKLRAVMREIALEHPKGRPILIGTTSVEASEALSSLLRELEVPHQVLNARPELAENESEIVAQAGRRFAITIATNMAGRGTDIILGGNPMILAKSCLWDVLLQALKSNKNVSKEIQSLEEKEISLPLTGNEFSKDETRDAIEQTKKAVAADDGFVKFCKSGKLLDKVVELITNGEVSSGPRLEIEDIMAIDTWNQICSTFLQIKSEVQEGCGREKEIVMDVGGLYVIGTERHESRRIDNQLRGRSGRQGDSGASRFILALDDKLFRVFGGDKMKGVLNAFRVDEDTPIENTMVTNAINSAQNSVEAYYADLRRALAEYDQVGSIQRNDFYGRRRALLMGADADLRNTMLELCAATGEEIVNGYIGRSGQADDCSGLSTKLKQFFTNINAVEPADLEKFSGPKKKADILSHIRKAIEQALNEKEQEIRAVSSNPAAEIERFIILSQYDNLWKQHIKNMQFLQDAAGYQAMGEGDPLDIYKARGLELYNEVLNSVRRNAVFSLFQYKPTKTADMAVTSSNKKGEKK